MPATLDRGLGCSLAEARRLVQDLYPVRSWIYWLDFTASYALGSFFFFQVRGISLLEPHQGFTGEFSQVFYFVASCLLFYRCSIFIHEVVHQRSSPNLRVFRLVWNVLCGIPFLVPSFTYFPHVDHHRRSSYGTDEDGEYLPLAHRRKLQLLMYVGWSAVIPLLAIIRFLILSPLAWVFPSVRQMVHRHASTLVMDPFFERLPAKSKVRRLIFWQELGCFAWCLVIAVVTPLMLRAWPTPFLIHAYLMAVVIVFLNSVRTLGSHRWAHQNESLSFSQQIADSVNYDQGLIAELWGPVGTRFHALHHLFPMLPYHALPAAHARLTAALPRDSLYHGTRENSLTGAITKLWRRMA